ncbi:MAG: VWA domain-containing protein [Saprospiraceae bacterium]|nr:VWA domain-containing protein [Saprospiraceae bacterium]
MNTIKILFVICSVALFGLPGKSQLTSEKSLSPYFHVKSQSKVDDFPLQASHSQVNIVGTLADVTITQRYKNDGQSPLEAVYVFPGSTRAAVYAMTAVMGGDTIRAKIEEKQKAKAIFTKAVKDGKRAALLEQERPNVFKMSVGNILPGDIVEVELKYTELLVPENKEYEFYFPTVVGPRFTGESNDSGSGFTNTPYLKEGEQSPFDFDLSCSIHSGINIRLVTSPSHKIDVRYPDLKSALVEFDSEEKNPAGKDFILKYQLAGDKIESGISLYDHGDEKFFTLMMEPPARITNSHIPNREYVFIVDVSGSMSGYPLDVSKQLLKDLLVELHPADRFNIVFFAGDSRLWSESSKSANQENLETALQFMNSLSGGGGTYLLQALKTAMDLPKAVGPEARCFVIISDGYINVEKECFDYIRENLDRANFFSFGIGSSPNVHLMDGIAHVGGGEATIVNGKEDGPKKAEDFRKYIEKPVLSKIKVDFQGFKAYDLNLKKVPDVLAERPLIIQGKWKGPIEGKVCISGLTGSGKFQRCIDLKDANQSPDNSPIRYHWARERIRLLDDYRLNGYGDKLQKETLELGLKYNLLTAYTSFVAVQEKKVAGEKAVLVKQPLPLPHHVSNMAVGFEASVKGISFPKSVPARPNYRIQSMTFNGKRISEPWAFEKLWLDVFAVLKKEVKQPCFIRIKLNQNGKILEIQKDGTAWLNFKIQSLVGKTYSNLSIYGQGTLEINFHQ